MSLPLLKIDSPVTDSNDSTDVCQSSDFQDVHKGRKNFSQNFNFSQSSNGQNSRDISNNTVTNDVNSEVGPEKEIKPVVNVSGLISDSEVKGEKRPEKDNSINKLEKIRKKSAEVIKNMIYYVKKVKKVK